MELSIRREDNWQNIGTLCINKRENNSYNRWGTRTLFNFSLYGFGISFEFHYSQAISSIAHQVRINSVILVADRLSIKFVCGLVWLISLPPESIFLKVLRVNISQTVKNFLSPTRVSKSGLLTQKPELRMFYFLDLKILFLFLGADNQVQLPEHDGIDICSSFFADKLLIELREQSF